LLRSVSVLDVLQKYACARLVSTHFPLRKAPGVVKKAR
jgi:hypothetical protein